MKADRERITITYESNGAKVSVSREVEAVQLDDMTWSWLLGAFCAIGFSTDQVKEFFDEQQV
jgi:hypothetical protein